MKKLFKNPFFLIVLGALCVYLAFAGTTDKVKCRDVEMKPGDICGTLTYEEKQRGNNIFTYGLLGVGAILIIGSIAAISKRRKAKKK